MGKILSSLQETLSGKTPLESPSSSSSEIELTQLNEERQNQQTSINEQRRYTDVEVQSSINQLNIDISPEILEQVENIRKIILELPTLTSEQKENLCQSVKNMETYCNNTKLLFEKYQHSGEIQKLFEKIMQEIPYLNNSKVNKNIEMKFMNGTIIFIIDDDNFFDHLGIGGALLPEITIDAIPCCPIILGKQYENTKVLSHELQHFINKFLVGKEENDEESFEKIVSSALQDEVIAQTIGGSYGDGADDLMSNIADSMSTSAASGKVCGYSFGNMVSNNSTLAMVANMFLLNHLEKIEIAYALRDANIKNYEYILATTPFLKRDELKKLYLL